MKFKRYLFQASIAILFMAVLSSIAFPNPSSEPTLPVRHDELNLHEVDLKQERRTVKSLSTPELFEALGTGPSYFQHYINLEISDRFDKENPEEREEIISALENILERQADPYKRARAMSCLNLFTFSSLSSRDKEHIIDVLLHTIATDNDSLVVRFAIGSIPAFNSSERAFKTIISVLDRDVRRERGVTKTTFISLGKMGEISVPFLIDSIRNYPEEAILGLAHTNSENALAHLIGIFNGEDPQLRSLAIHALGQFRHQDDVNPKHNTIIENILLNAVNDEQEGVRRKAHRALEL